MVDPEWLIEENKLEKRSKSIQTFSNSSVMCLDEIKKLLEKGDVAKEEVDTFTLLLTNFNTEANQQIDSDIVNAPMKKYQSLLLLPTFINSPENEGMRSSSRRSLHPEKKLKSPSSTVQSEFLSPRLAKNCDDNDKQYAMTKKTAEEGNTKCVIAALASVETLNSSEKDSIQSIEDFMSSLDYTIESQGMLLWN